MDAILLKIFAVHTQKHTVHVKTVEMKKIKCYKGNGRRSNIVVKVCLNDIISKKYVMLAEQYGKYSYEQCERMRYALKVMLNEIEKIILLGIICAY